MRIRWIALFAVVAIFVVACSNDEPELSTDSTIVTGGPSGTDPASAPSTTQGGGGGSSPSTTLVGETVDSYEVVAEIPNDNGVAQLIVIPDGAYTDVDLQNFIIDLIEGNEDLYGAEVFNNAAAADAFLIPEADRTDEQNELLESHHLVTLTGRARIDFRGPMADFPGSAIGS